MFNIENNIIKITKGDSASIHVDLINEGGVEYIMEEGDTLTFTVRKMIGSPVLAKIVSHDNTIDITPTVSKEFEVGSCVYDIQLRTTADDVFTIVGLENMSQVNMYVMPEVTED